MLRDYYFTDSQINQMRDGALSILSEIGIKIGRQDILDKLINKGFHASGQYIKIDKKTALNKIMQKKGESKSKRTNLTTFPSPYTHTYEDVDGNYIEISTHSNTEMGKFVMNTSKIWKGLTPMCPGHPVDVPYELQFFRQQINSFIWCEGFNPMEPVSIKVAPFQFELCETMGKPITGIPIYMATPLTLGGESFDIAYRFANKLSQVWVGSMPSLGANTPLNLAAAYAQTIAENTGGAIIYEELTGVQTIYNVNIFPFDFFDFSMAFGTPEKLLLEWLNMEVTSRIGGGDFYGPWGVDIHTNAPKCGLQACIEKASLMTAGAVLGAGGFGCSGTLAMDEVFSPVQLLLDMEIQTHVQKIVDGLPNNDFKGDLLNEIREGIESGYVMSNRTLDNIYDFNWKSEFFTRKSYNALRNNNFKPEIERAKEKAREIFTKPPAWKLNDLLEKEAEKIYLNALYAIEMA